MKLLPKKPIQKLLKNNVLNPEIAAFLYFNILNSKNITVIGGQKAGKTNLINTFDLLTPKELRKIYVEDKNKSLRNYWRERYQDRIDFEDFFVMKI